MSIFQTSVWAYNHFSNAKLGDTRRTNRLVNVADLAAKSSGESIARACDGKDSAIEGAYRLIRNEHIKPHEIRNSGFAYTASQAHEFNEIIAIDDTTSLSYKHSVAGSLGKLGKETDKARGWWVHSTLLLDGLTTKTIGLITQDWWLRPNEYAESDEKESGKWSDSSYFMRNRLGSEMKKVISVCDREADFFDYMVDKLDHEERFVIRAKHNRKLEDGTKLFDFVATQESIGSYTIEVPQKGVRNKRTGKVKNRPKRKAKLTVKTANTTIKSMNINVIHAEEVGEEEDKLSWTLLTTEPVNNLEAAMKIIDIYTARWRIEDFHKSWKTGSGVERLRMTRADNLERVASVLAFIGVRLLQLKEALTVSIYLKKKGLMKEAELHENTKCDRVLEEDEWKLLLYLQPQWSMKTSTIPTLKEAYEAIAKLGGFYDSKRTGIASWETIWNGWSKLQDTP